jgi:ATP-binding cassette subfamily B (MDR/TAP) protein 1
MEFTVTGERPLQNGELHISIPAPTASRVYSRRSVNTFGNPQTRLKPHHPFQHPHAAKTPKTPASSQTGVGTVGGWKSLFNFTTGKHIPVLILSVLFSVIVGVITPFQAYLMGKVFSNFAQFGAGTLSEDEFKRGLTTYNIYFLLLGAVCWLFSSALFTSWMLFGELQARSARERLFNALLKRRIEWFDQKKDGLGALTTRMQR